MGPSGLYVVRGFSMNSFAPAVRLGFGKIPRILHILGRCYHVSLYQVYKDQPAPPRNHAVIPRFMCAEFHGTQVRHCREHQQLANTGQQFASTGSDSKINKVQPKSVRFSRNELGGTQQPAVVEVGVDAK